MIESTAIVYPDSQIADDAYVGHYSIIGHPRRVPVTSDPASADTSRKFWETSRGAVVKSLAVISPYCHLDDLCIVGPGAWIGSGSRIGHETRIGCRVQLYYRAQVYDRVVVADDAVITGFICNDARVGRRSQVFGSLVHKLVGAPSGGADPYPAESEPPPIIEDDVIVGMNAIVVGGVTVHNGAYIGAGSVLTTDAEPGVLYLGNPARPRGPAPRPFADIALD